MPNQNNEATNIKPEKKKPLSDKAVAVIKLSVVFIILLLMFFLAVFDAAPGRAFVKNADAVDGVADRVNADDFKSSLFLLDGEWEYYPGELLGPDDFNNNTSNIKYATVPHYWVDDPVGMPDGKGYATYRMTVSNPAPTEYVGVYAGYQHGAYKIFINGRYATGSGNVSENKEEYYLSYTGGVGIITEPGGDSVEIIVQVQCYDHVSAGLSDNILFGGATVIKNYHIFLMTITGITAGAVLILMFYFLLLFILNTKKKEYFNFAVVLLCCFYITLSFCGENIVYYLVPAVSPFLLYKLEYIALMLGGFFASLHIIQKYTGLKHFTKIAAAYTALNCLLVVLITPYRLSSMGMVFYALIVIFVAVALGISFFNAFFAKSGSARHKIRSGATLELLSLLILFGGSAVSQFGFTIWEGFYMLPVFVLLYCFIQIFVLSEYYNDVEKNLYKLNKTLENRVTERTTRLVELSRKLQAANNVKTEFLTYMSHELCTPMNDIVSMSDLFDAESLSDVQKDRFNSIKKTSEALLSLVNDIMDYSKLEAGETEPAPTHFLLYPFFENICSEARISAKEKNLRFDCKTKGELPPVIFADEVRMKQIIAVIVANAIKSADEGCVRLEATAVGSADSELSLLFTISVPGKGIDAEALPNLFDAFINPKKMNEYGLSFALCKRLVTLLNGSIEVESGNDDCVFKVQLPIKAGDISSVENLNINERIYAKNANVLLVEDNPMSVTVAHGIFAAHDITPDVAEDGYKALNMIREKDYDIIFMDQFLPGIDGIETTRRIREMGGKYASLPVVALTANSAPGAKDMLLFKGMDEYLPKPVDRALLNSILVKLLPYDKISSALGRFEQLDVDEKSDILEGLPLEIVKLTDLNCAAVLEGMDGNIEVYINLLRALTEESANYVDGLTNELSSGTKNLSNYVIIINGIKNMLYSVGAKACADSAAALERAALKNDCDFCLDKNGAFCENLRWLSQRIGFALAALGSNEPATSLMAQVDYDISESPDLTQNTEGSDNNQPRTYKGTPQKLAGIMQDLSFCLFIGDCDNIDKRVSVLRQYTFAPLGEKYDNMISEIISNAKIMDYDGAAEVCREIIKSLLKIEEQ